MKAIIYKLLLEQRYSMIDFLIIYLIAVLVHNIL